MNTVYDIAVVGSGFAGSLLAMTARRLGRSVLLLERGRHPRVVIGESSTPLSNLLLEDIADRYDLPMLRPLTKWGTWQRSYPELACGLKRGFTFFHHDLARPESRLHEDAFLVEASPRDSIADTHWYRADLDEFLVEEARLIGVEYVDAVSLKSFVDSGDEVVLQGVRESVDVSYRARFVVDATGPRGFLHHALDLHDAHLPGYPATSALYSHFSGVAPVYNRVESRPAEQPPYPVDHAAVHHIFDGGWIWVLQFNNGITSAGVAATGEVAARLRLSEGEDAWRHLLSKIPGLDEQFAMAKRERTFTYVQKLSFRSSAMSGQRWAMLPSAAGFVDPLLSTGFPLALLGVSRLAEILDRSWDTVDFAEQIRCYATRTEEELLATARLLAALYGNMDKFEVFRALSLLYFAAASFSETARRLGKPEIAASFLLHDHPVFGQECRRLLARVADGVPVEEVDEFVREVRRVVEPIDVAGLSRDQTKAWYPVVAQDLLDAGWKLGATRSEVTQLLERAGFYATPA